MDEGVPSTNKIDPIHEQDIVILKQFLVDNWNRSYPDDMKLNQLCLLTRLSPETIKATLSSLRITFLSDYIRYVKNENPDIHLNETIFRKHVPLEIRFQQNPSEIKPSTIEFSASLENKKVPTFQANNRKRNLYPKISTYICIRNKRHPHYELNKRKNVIFKDWLRANCPNIYPDKADLTALATKAGVSNRQASKSLYRLRKEFLPLIKR